MLKKGMALLLACFMLFTFAACGGPSAAQESEIAQTADGDQENVEAPEKAENAPTDSQPGDSAPASTAQPDVDYTGYTNVEFLAAVKSWQNKDVPGVIYTFYEDGTGELTVDNKRNVYKMAWSVEDGVLKFEMENWPYINDVQYYDIVTDKEDPSFASYNPDSGSEAVFVPLGTVPFPAYEDNKPEELLGFWVMVDDPEAKNLRIWLLNPKTERSGYGLYYPEEEMLFIEHYFDDWNMVGDDSLVFVMENGTVSTDPFNLEDDKLNLTDRNVIFERLDVSGIEITE